MFICFLLCIYCQCSLRQNSSRESSQSLPGVRGRFSISLRRTLPPSITNTRLSVRIPNSVSCVSFSGCHVQCFSSKQTQIQNIFRQIRSAMRRLPTTELSAWLLHIHCQSNTSAMRQDISFEKKFPSLRGYMTPDELCRGDSFDRWRCCWAIETTPRGARAAKLKLALRRMQEPQVV